MPFFNFTNNMYSEEQLLHLRITAPEKEAIVTQRTAVIKGMIATRVVLDNFTYRKLDLHERHAFMENIAGTALKENSLKTWLRLKIHD